MDFDYVALSSEGDKDLLDLHLSSIRRTNGPKDIFVVDKTDAGFGAISGCEIRRIPRYKLKSTPCIPATLACSGFVSHFYDVADSYNYALNECGTKRFCMVSHLDLVYTSSGIWDKIRSLNEADVIGDCRCLILIDREAYRATHFGFWALPDLHAKRMDDIDGVWLRGGDQDGSTFVSRLDVGDLMFLELRLMGFKVIEHEFWASYFKHAGCGSRHSHSQTDGSASTVYHESRRQDLFT